MENDNDDNVIDFIAYKMRNFVEDLAANGYTDAANTMQDALDRHMLGELTIVFVDGWPHAIDTKDIEYDLDT
jgi:hypothetical protein